jgi:hypothetical protein
MLPRVPGLTISPGRETRQTSSATVVVDEQASSMPEATPVLSYGTFNPASTTTADPRPYEHEIVEVPDNDSLSTLRRLRFIFRLLVAPIVPLGVLTFVSLLWFIFAYFLDFNSDCAPPIKRYASLTLFLVLYLPHNAKLRNWLVSLEQERLRANCATQWNMLVYGFSVFVAMAGCAQVRICREDAVSHAPSNESGSNDVVESVAFTGGALHDCAATCPNLYPALVVFTTSLEFFTLSCVLPLLLLPCLYVWFIRQEEASDEFLSLVQEQLREEESFLGGPPVVAQDILQDLEPVKLVVRKIDGQEEQTWVVPIGASSEDQGKEARGARECCICMNEFALTPQESVLLERDIETGEKDSALPDSDEIVRTRICGHLFHKRCMAGWVGQQWGDDTAWRSRRPKRSTCPLCRRDMRPSAHS